MKSINTILIANRGEIASRIIRSCRKMGIKSIAVFSEADRDAIFVQEADSAYFIGDSSPSSSYLDQNKIIITAQKAGADAIHPGYGFLSENANFAQNCLDVGIVFIGPHPEAIRAMGSKDTAKTLMIKHNVPVILGYQGNDQSPKRLQKEAKKIGFPVLLKAVAGGGGKGMRIVHNSSEMPNAIAAVKREAKSAFGNDELLVEKYISSARHIEFQILGDKHGNVIHILERECSVQRRYQKVLEESPSPVLTPEVRKIMGEAAVNAAKALKYDNAGTVEFIYEKDGSFYFLEVNTRLQVEHPVTEEITGIDLVQLQIEVAEGQALTLRQEDVKSNGYAIECRLYAEDATNDFFPATGTVLQWDVPSVEGLRIERAIGAGSEISIYYDPMIAKIIVWAENRNIAHRKMEYVLRNLVCLGLTTNQDFLLHLFQNQSIRNGNYDTHFIENHINLSLLSKQTKEHKKLSAISACLYGWKRRDSKRKTFVSMPSAWRNVFREYEFEDYIIGEDCITLKYHLKENIFTFLIEDKIYKCLLISANDTQLRFEFDGTQYTFNISQKGQLLYTHNEETGNITLEHKERFPAPKGDDIKGGYIAPMPSQIVKILVKEGQSIKSGDSLMVITSMKMENTIIANEDGIVGEIYTTEGSNVEAGFLLLRFK